MKAGKILLGIFVAIGVVAYLSVIIVKEVNQAIILQFGDPKRIIMKPGLNFKIPFIQNVVYLDKRILRFHTDNRAAKIQAINESNLASVVGYDPDLKVQIKMTGNVDVHFNDKVTEDAWNESTPRSKKCYSVKGGSSLEIKNPADYDIKDFEVEDGYENFAVLIFNFISLEFLYLKSSGHRRALHNWEDKYTATWLVP